MKHSPHVAARDQFARTAHPFQSRHRRRQAVRGRGERDRARGERRGRSPDWVTTQKGRADDARARGRGKYGAPGRGVRRPPETFAGLAGMGDLIVTCESRYGRNRRVNPDLNRAGRDGGGGGGVDRPDHWRADDGTRPARPLAPSRHRAARSPKACAQSSEGRCRSPSSPGGSWEATNRRVDCESASPSARRSHGRCGSRRRLRRWLQGRLRVRRSAKARRSHPRAPSASSR